MPEHSGSEPACHLLPQRLRPDRRVRRGLQGRQSCGPRPSAQIVDVTHGIPPFDVRAGALTLARPIQYLPPGRRAGRRRPGRRDRPAGRGRGGRDGVPGRARQRPARPGRGHARRGPPGRDAHQRGVPARGARGRRSPAATSSPRPPPTWPPARRSTELGELVDPMSLIAGDDPAAQPDEDGLPPARSSGSTATATPSSTSTPPSWPPWASSPGGPAGSPHRAGRRPAAGSGPTPRPGPIELAVVVDSYGLVSLTPTTGARRPSARPAARLGGHPGPRRPAGGGMRSGTAIVLGLLLLLIFAAAVIQFVLMGRGPRRGPRPGGGCPAPGS